MKMKLEMTFDLPTEAEAFEAFYNSPSNLLALRKLKKELFNLDYDRSRVKDPRDILVGLGFIEDRFNKILEDLGVNL